MGRGDGGKEKRSTFGSYTPPRKPTCPGCGLTDRYNYHERGCSWAQANDPGRIRALSEQDLVGRKLTVIAADFELLRFTVDGEPGEIYEVKEVETDDYTIDGGLETYRRFDFSRVEPLPKFPQPELPRD